VPGSRGEPGLITTLYLTSTEYDVLSALPAAALRNTRLGIPPLGVDVFEDNLTGLVLGEAEFDDDTAMTAFGRPANAVAEVTHDPRLSGGRLANTTATALAMTPRDWAPIPTATRRVRPRPHPNGLRRRVPSRRRPCGQRRRHRMAIRASGIANSDTNCGCAAPSHPDREDLATRDLQA
jgi:hypothetical protein